MNPTTQQRWFDSATGRNQVHFITERSATRTGPTAAVRTGRTQPVLTAIVTHPVPSHTETRWRSTAAAAAPQPGGFGRIFRDFVEPRLFRPNRIHELPEPALTARSPAG